MADAAAAPAVSAIDPVQLVKQNEEFSIRINRLEGDKQDLQRQIDILNGKLAHEKSAASSARGAMKPMKEQIDTLRAHLSSSEDVKEMARLRAEVAALHTDAAKLERSRAEEDKKTKAQVQEFSVRATRAEGKFQALESTASIMAKARDKANEAAAALLAERDEALKKAAAIQEDFDGMRAEFVKAKADLEKSQAEAKALRQAPAVKAK